MSMSVAIQSVMASVQCRMSAKEEGEKERRELAAAACSSNRSSRVPVVESINGSSALSSRIPLADGK